MRERGRRGPAFLAACLSLSPSLKLLLIKQSGAKEAGPFHAPCWDQRRLSGNATGPQSWQAARRPVLMSSETYSFDQKHVPCRPFVLCWDWLPPAPSGLMGPETRTGSSLFLSLRLVLAFKAFRCDIRSLGRKLAFICLEHKWPVAPRSDSGAVESMETHSTLCSKWPGITSGLFTP